MYFNMYNVIGVKTGLRTGRSSVEAPRELRAPTGVLDADPRWRGPYPTHRGKP